MRLSHCSLTGWFVTAMLLHGSAGVSWADDATTQAIRDAMVENLVAADAEDMPRLLATMSREMPNRELFIRETKQEWAVADTYTRLVEIEVLKHSNAPHANTRLPYATVRVVQTMLKSDRKPGSEDPSEWSRRMLLDQKHPTVEYETLWKREGGQWRMVAGLTEPRPVHAQTKEYRLVAENAEPVCTEWAL